MRLRALCVGLIGVGTLAPGRADAQVDQDLSALLDEPVVTTASSTAETGTSAPATSSTITAEDIRRYGIHTLQEAVSFLAVGMTGQHQLDDDELGARGVEISSDAGNHFLLLIDGHKVNEPYQSFDLFGRFLGVPLEIVDHIEVVLGPGSVLYGSNAMLGVINVVTARGKTLQGARVGVYADIATLVRPWASLGATFRLFGVPSELTVGIEYLHAEGPKYYFPSELAGLLPSGQELTWGGAVASNSSRADSGAIVTRLITGHFDVTLRAQGSVSPVWSDFGDFDSPEARRTDRALSIGIKHEATLSSIVRVNTRLYAAHTDHDIVYTVTNLDFCPLTNMTCRFDTRSQSRWAGVEVQPVFDWFRDGRFVTMVGVDATARGVLAKVDAFDDVTSRPISSSVGVIDHSDLIVGAYGQQIWIPARWLELNGGARYDYDERFAGVVSPRVAATVQPWKGGALKGIFSEAFRAPTFYESYFSTPFVPLPDPLRPEKTRSVEGSIEQRFAAQRIFFGVFHTTMTDIIQNFQFDPLSAAQFLQQGRSTVLPLYQERNLESIDSTGYDAGIEGSFAEHKFTYGLSGTTAYARATAFGSTKPLAVAPRTFGNARLSYVFPDAWPTVALAARWMSSRLVENYATYSGSPSVPAFIELRATVSGDVPFAHGLSYRVSANYVSSERTPFLVGPTLDRTPSVHPVDPFRVTVGLTYEFPQ